MWFALQITFIARLAGRDLGIVHRLSSLCHPQPQVLVGQPQTAIQTRLEIFQFVVIDHQLNHGVNRQRPRA